ILPLALDSAPDARILLEPDEARPRGVAVLGPSTRERLERSAVARRIAAEDEERRREHVAEDGRARPDGRSQDRPHRPSRARIDDVPPLAAPSTEYTFRRARGREDARFDELDLEEDLARLARMLDRGPPSLSRRRPPPCRDRRTPRHDGAALDASRSKELDDAVDDVALSDSTEIENRAWPREPHGGALDVDLDVTHPHDLERLGDLLIARLARRHVDEPPQLEKEADRGIERAFGPLPRLPRERQDAQEIGADHHRTLGRRAIDEGELALRIELRERPLEAEDEVENPLDERSERWLALRPPQEKDVLRPERPQRVTLPPVAELVGLEQSFERRLVRGVEHSRPAGKACFSPNGGSVRRDDSTR